MDRLGRPCHRERKRCGRMLFASFPHERYNVTGWLEGQKIYFITYFVDRIPESVNFSHLGVAWHGQ